MLAFIIAEKTEEERMTSRAKLLDELAKFKGELYSELKLNEEGSIALMVVMSDDQLMLKAWKQTVDNVTVLNEVKDCKMLVIEASTQEEASKQLEIMLSAIHEYQGMVVTGKCVSLVEREMLLYFSKSENMKRFQEKYSITV